MTRKTLSGNANRRKVASAEEPMEKALKEG